MAATPATPAPSRWGAAGEALRLSPFRVLLWTQVATGLTQPLLFFAQGWYVNSVAPEGNQTIYLGLLGASRGIVFLLYVTVGGAMADRFPRITVLRASHVLGFVLIVMIDALLWVPMIGSGAGMALPLMIALFASFGLIMAQDVPTRTSMARETLPDHVAGGGIALFQMAQAAMLLFSAPFAGWAIMRLGIPTTYLLAAAGPLLVFLLSYRLPRALAADPEASSTSLVANIRDGFRVLRDQPALRWTVFLTWISTAAGLSVMGVIVAAWVSDVLRLDAAGWGYMAFFWGAGSIVSSVYMTARGFGRRRGPVFLGTSLLFGVAVLGFALSRSVPLAFAFNGLAGLAFMAFNISGLGIVQALTPNRYLGRVTGLLLLGFGLMQVIALGVGILARFVGIEVVYVGAGLTMIAATLLVALLQRPLRTLD
jgi:MFS family permease